MKIETAQERSLQHDVMEHVKARDRNEAVSLIEAQAAQLVELDYEDGALDVVELSRLGRKWRVGILFRMQEAIAVESMRALLCGLNADKDTFRQRHLFCMFDMAACTQEDVKRAHARATLLGDFIFPGPIQPVEALIKKMPRYWK